MKVDYYNQIELAPGLSYNSLKLQTKDRVHSIPVSIWKKILYKMGGGRLVERLFRLVPRTAIQLDEERYLISLKDGLYIWNIKSDNLKKIWSIRKGWSQVLNIFHSDGIAYWGDYGSNPDYQDVKIYSLDKSGIVRVVYAFSKGTIRHIHNIIGSKHSERLWILTGDTESMSGIYLVESNFKSICPIAVGEQRYRAVMAFPEANGLYYATDAVSEENHLYKLFFSDENVKVQLVRPIEGSCIYGVELKDYYIFSTTVEPPEGAGLRTLFSRKLGKGIKSSYSTVLAVKKDSGEIREIFRVKKDCLPGKLFQYGTITFPSGQYCGNVLKFNLIACGPNEGKSSSIDIDHVWPTLV